MKRFALMILCLTATLFLATSAFCQRLRPVTIGLTGKSLATAAFEMSLRNGHFKKQGLDVKFITIRQSDVIIKAIMRYPVHAVNAKTQARSGRLLIRSIFFRATFTKRTMSPTTAMPRLASSSASSMLRGNTSSQMIARTQSSTPAIVHITPARPKR